MATLTAADIARTGVDVAGVTPGGSGDEWANTGKEFIEVKNGSGSSITVTLDIKSTVDGAAVTDPSFTVAAGVTKAAGPFPTGIYNDSSTGRAKATCSATTDVTIKVLKLTPSN